MASITQENMSMVARRSYVEPRSIRGPFSPRPEGEESHSHFSESRVVRERPAAICVLRLLGGKFPRSKPDGR